MVTVVFIDIVGSRDLAERLDPESFRDALTQYFRRMRAALERHGGLLDKYVGDAMMGIFGVQQVHEDDALRAVRAAKTTFDLTRHSIRTDSVEPLVLRGREQPVAAYRLLSLADGDGVRP